MKQKIMLILGLLLLVPFFGGQVVKAADTNTSSTFNGTIATKTLTPLYAKGEDGNFTKVGTRSLAAKSTWYSDQSIYNSATQSSFYRVSTNEWVKFGDDTLAQSPNYKLDAQVDNYQSINAKVIKINNAAAAVYNDFGEKTGQTVPANSSWKVDMSYMVGVPGVDGFNVYQRIGNNAWINLNNDATVIAIL